MENSKPPPSQGFATGRLLAKNSILNFVGMMLPLIAGIFALPFAIKGLGKDGFGVLAIAWVILGYFGLFDFGGELLPVYAPFAQGLPTGLSLFSSRFVFCDLPVDKLLPSRANILNNTCSNRVW